MTVSHKFIKMIGHRFFKFLRSNSTPKNTHIMRKLKPFPFLKRIMKMSSNSRRMSLLYCSLTGTASNWYDRLPQVYKDDWSSFLQIFKKQFYSQKHAYHAQIEALSLLKKDNENVVTSLLKSKPL